MACESGSSRQTELEFIQGMYPDDLPAQFTFLYESLSILDAKASSLMAFNAIGLAAIAIWLQYVPPNWLHLALDIAFVLLLVSALRCLAVVRVRWFTESESEAGVQSVRGAGVPEAVLLKLLELRNHRTRAYEGAWQLAQVAVAIFLVASVIHAVGTAIIATGHAPPALFSQDVWGNRQF